MSTTGMHWRGKSDGRGSNVEPARAAPSLRTVEEMAAVRPVAWQNRLIRGDTKLVLPALLPEFRGRIDLIYVDPPFFTGGGYEYSAAVPETNGRVTRAAYSDARAGGLDRYLRWFHETVVLLRELLAPAGSIYVHLDWHVSHYAKVILDEVFGGKRFINEIVWKRSANTSSLGRIWKRAHDAILFYSRSDRYTFHRQRRALAEATRGIYTLRDERGLYRLVPLLVSGKRNGVTGRPWRGIDPKRRGRHGMHWVTVPQQLEEYDRQGLIAWPERNDGAPNLKYYLADHPGVVVSDWWDDVPAIAPLGRESVRYPTQKPEALLERIIRASSSEGDTILDCFCGSGTAPVVAEKSNRRWIAVDSGEVAIHTTRKRLLGLDALRPFLLQQAESTAGRSAPPGRNKRRINVKVTVQGENVTIQLVGFLSGKSDKAPRTARRRWTEWVDYWAIDWEFDGHVFRPGWSAIRGRGQSPLPLAAAHRYSAAGAYSVAVRVADLLGRESAHRLQVRLATPQRKRKGRRVCPAPLPLPRN